MELCADIVIEKAPPSEAKNAHADAFSKLVHALFMSSLSFG